MVLTRVHFHGPCSSVGGGDVGNKHVVLQHMQPELRSEQLSQRLVRSEPIQLGLQSETMG